MQVCTRCRHENPEGARFCNACGAPLAEAAAGGREERKVITVVFCDLVGFTERAERLDPEDVRAVLAPYHRRLRAELERFGGTVEKFIGDAVMALFGAPVAHEDDPERAVRAALAIRDEIAEENRLQVRIGVATGEALISLDARPEAGEAMASGDVVNVAARLEAAGPVNGVLVDETTHRVTRAGIEYREAHAIHAKGKAEPVAAWEALEPTARVGVDVNGESRAPLIGRTRELEALVATLARVREERSPQLVTLVGVPGIGKSRLVQELFQEVDRQPELVNWRQGRCLPYGDGVTFWALGEIVKAQAGILESDPGDAVAEKLRRAVDALVPDDAESRWLERGLRPLAGLAGEDGQAEAGEEVVGAWRRFFEALGEHGPTVLVFEDLHWADDGLLDFLDELLDWLRGVPILVVATARPELLDRRADWGGGKANATTLSLPPLTPDETGRLIEELRGDASPLSGESDVVERVDGNPLFAEQYVRMLAEQVEVGALPESVQGVMASRLDALPSQEKELLQNAAVHGRAFWLGGLAAAVGLEESEVDELLRRLQRKEFVRRERRSDLAGDTQYAFRHVLLRDVAYGQLPRAVRARKHLAAAEWIEALGRPDDHAEMLAHHYRRALELMEAVGEEPGAALIARARQSLRDAGERALSLGANHSALEFFDAALELAAAGDADRPRLLLDRGRAVFATGGAGIDVVTAALEAFQRAGDTEEAAQAATLAARFSWFVGDRAATDRYIAHALEIVGDRPRSRAKAEALTNQSGFQMLGGEFEDSIRTGAEALRLVEELHMDTQRARLHIVGGCARACLGDVDGLREIEVGISEARAAGSPEMLAIGHGNLASELYFFGRLQEAREAMQESLEVARRYQLPRMVRGAEMAMVGWSYADGDWERAARGVDELIMVAEAGARDYTDPEILALRARIRLGHGDLAGADADSARAGELASGSDAQAHGSSFTARARVALEAGDRAEAEERASRLADMGRVLLAAICSPGITFADVAWVFRDLGRADDFIASLVDSTPIESPWKEAARAIAGNSPAAAADIIEGIGHGASAAYTRMRAGEALAAEGRTGEAREQLARAESFYRDAGAAEYLARCRNAAAGQTLRARS